MTRKLPTTIAILTAAIALLLANTASATPPTTVQMPGDYSQSFSGPDSPCGFDITFIAAGTVTVTTYYHNAGLPIRESVHGSLSHTVSSAWHTLFSKGPAPVHIDLTAGLAVDTGKEFAFHIPGSGVVWAQNGRFVFGDNGLISYTGLNTPSIRQRCAPRCPCESEDTLIPPSTSGHTNVARARKTRRSPATTGTRKRAPRRRMPHESTEECQNSGSARNPSFDALPCRVGTRM
jgi:hypothetical protein